MRGQRSRTFFLSALLGLMVAWGSVICLITAFDLQTENLSRLIWICGIIAAGSGFLFLCRHGDLLTCGILSAAVGFLFYTDQLPEQMAMLICQVANRYDTVYHWGGFMVPEGPQWVDLPLTILGIFLAVAVTYSVSGRRSAMPAVAIALFSLALCMVAPDTVPNLWALAAVLVGLVLVVLSGSVRREAPAQGDRLVLLTALPVLALVGLVLLLFPQERYVDHSQGLRDYVLDYMQAIPAWAPESGDVLTPPIREKSESQVNLAALDGQDQLEISVMRVTSPKSEALYLRGRDYDVYTGTGWSSSGSREEDFGGWGDAPGAITVETFGLHDVLYVPYYPAGSTKLSDGMVPNPRGLTQYIFQRQERGRVVDWQILEQCLVLPESTRRAVEGYLPQGIQNNREMVERIGEIVRSTAPYNRTTGQMPQEESDFVLWFLSRADTGYCVHFASSAVVLLRAAGIPARYVTGYRVDAVAGEPVVVSSEQAHAWAEYYNEDWGCWSVLEATPGDFSSILPKPTEPETVPTEEPETTVAPEPTQPEPIPAEKKPRNVGWLFWLLPLLPLGWVQRWVRVWLGRKLRRRGTMNRQATFLWKECATLAGLLGEELPEQLTTLAEKASFSQHTLTAKELEAFRAYGNRSRRRLRQRPWYLRLLYEYVYAIY